MNPPNLRTPASNPEFRIKTLTPTRTAPRSRATRPAPHVPRASNPILCTDHSLASTARTPENPSRTPAPASHHRTLASQSEPPHPEYLQHEPSEPPNPRLEPRTSASRLSRKLAPRHAQSPRDFISLFSPFSGPPFLRGAHAQNASTTESRLPANHVPAVDPKDTSVPMDQHWCASMPKIVQAHR